MSVNIRIMQKGFFRRKKFIIDDLVKMSHLSFGVMDENCQLIPNQIGDHTILFDRKYLQRGIEIYIQNHDICLNLSLPTSMDEIQLFYYLVKVYCEYMDTNEFVKDDWLMNIKDIDLQMVYDKRTSADALMDLKSKLSDHKYFEIFGILHPISIGENELNDFGTDLDLFGQYLHNQQALDAYYATPRIYNAHGRRIGMYALGADILTILPVEPYVVLNQIEGIEEWYVFMNDRLVKYRDLMGFIKKFDYYDANHRMVCLSKEEISEALNTLAIQKI